jgi:hypothetical protein
MSPATVLALAEWANSQPATLKDFRPLPAASGPLNRKEIVGTDTGGGGQGPDGSEGGDAT